MISPKSKSSYLFTLIFMGFLFCPLVFASAQDIVLNSNLRQLQVQAEIRARQMNLNVDERRYRADIFNKRAMVALQEKLSQISDLKKQSDVKDILDEMVYVNLAWTNHFVLVLENLDNVLQKAKSRRDKALQNGADISQIIIDIQKAERVIETSRQNVLNQISSIYVIDPNKISLIVKGGTVTQKSLVNEFRLQLKDLRDNLFSDLSFLRDGSIRDARIGVYGAIQTLSNTPRVDIR